MFSVVLVFQAELLCPRSVAAHRPEKVSEYELRLAIYNPSAGQEKQAWKCGRPLYRSTVILPYYICSVSSLYSVEFDWPKEVCK